MPRRHTPNAAFAFVLFVLGLFFAPLTVAQNPSPVPAAPSLPAKSYILMEFQGGQVLVDQQADERMEPASITKLMTGYVVFRELRNEKIKLSDMVTISERAWRMGGSKMFVEVNKQVSIEDLLQGMIIQSGNDASVALAEHLAGSEEAFASLMTQIAKQIGMHNTNFMNSTGWPDPEHYTTARDIAILARAIISEFPEYYKWYSQKEFSYNGITQHNRNSLLWRDAAVDGIKTGHTESAGYCLATSAKRDHMRLIAVVLGSKSERTRADESLALLNYGFRFYETHKLYSAGQAVAETRVWKGAKEMLPLGVNNDLYITVPRGQYKSMSAAMQLDARILAPVQKGQQLGKAQISLGDKLLAEVPLVAMEDVPEGGFVSRMIDEAKLYFE